MSFGVRVPASTSNLGAGFDFLGLAVDLWLEARLLEGTGDPKYGGTLSGMNPSSDALLGRLKQHGVTEGYRLEVDSDIPIGKGLGASAAALVAAGALARLVSDKALDRDILYAEASTLEGHPDNAGPAVYGGLVLAAERPTHLRLYKDLALALAIPEMSTDTKAARSLLRDEISRDVAIDQARRAAALVLGLQNGDPDLIAFGMEDRVAVPQRKQLIPGYDAAVEAGRAAGAYGVSMSGAGSALVAITESSSANKVAEAMASTLCGSENPAVPSTPAVSNEGVSRLGDSCDSEPKAF